MEGIAHEPIDSFSNSYCWLYHINDPDKLLITHSDRRSPSLWCSSLLGVFSRQGACLRWVDPPPVCYDITISQYTACLFLFDDAHICWWPMFRFSCLCLQKPCTVSTPSNPKIKYIHNGSISNRSIRIYIIPKKQWA